MEYGLNEHKTFNFNNACCGGSAFAHADGQESAEQIQNETETAEVITPTTVSSGFFTKNVMLNIPMWMLLAGVAFVGYKLLYKKA
jgi:hypothetical protein